MIKTLMAGDLGFAVQLDLLKMVYACHMHIRFDTAPLEHKRSS